MHTAVSHKNGLAIAPYHQPRPGAQPEYTRETQAKLTMLACSDPPAGQSQGALRLPADRKLLL